MRDHAMHRIEHGDLRPARHDHGIGRHAHDAPGLGWIVEARGPTACRRRCRLAMAARNQHHEGHRQRSRAHASRISVLERVIRCERLETRTHRPAATIAVVTFVVLVLEVTSTRLYAY